MLAQVRARRSDCEFANGLEVSAVMIFCWRKREQINSGSSVGLSSQEIAEYGRPKTNITEFEEEFGTMTRLQVDRGGPGDSPKRTVSGH